MEEPGDLENAEPAPPEAPTVGKSLPDPRERVLSLGSIAATVAALGALGTGAWLEKQALGEAGAEWFILAPLALGAVLLAELAVLAPRFRSKSRRSSRAGAPPEWSMLREPSATAAFRTELGAEEFESLARRWAHEEFAGSEVRAGPASDEDGRELRIASEAWGGHLTWLARWGVWAALGGCAAGAIGAFEARVRLDEGGRTVHALDPKGALPEGWSWGRVVPRTAPFEARMAFELEAVGIESSPPSTRIRIHEGGQALGPFEVTEGRAARYRGFEISQAGIGASSSVLVDLRVRDRASEVERLFPKLEPGRSVSLEDYRFKVLEIVKGGGEEGAGPSARIEYEEAGRPVERFWVFQDHPGYDAVHRKTSREHFALSAVRERVSSELRVSRDPGKGAFFAGLVAAWLAVAGAILLSRRSCRLKWRTGRIELQGRSAWAASFKRAIRRAERGLPGVAEPRSRLRKRAGWMVLAIAGTALALLSPKPWLWSWLRDSAGLGAVGLFAVAAGLRLFQAIQGGARPESALLPLGALALILLLSLPGRDASVCLVAVAALGATLASSVVWIALEAWEKRAESRKAGRPEGRRFWVERPASPGYSRFARWAVRCLGACGGLLLPWAALAPGVADPRPAWGFGLLGALAASGLAGLRRRSVSAPARNPEPGLADRHVAFLGFTLLTAHLLSGAALQGGGGSGGPGFGSSGLRWAFAAWLIYAVDLLHPRCEKRAAIVMSAMGCMAIWLAFFSAGP